MKRLLAAGVGFLGLAVSGSAARAVPIDFTYTGSLVDFAVPATDPYQIRSSPLARRAEAARGSACIYQVLGVSVPRSAATLS
jgi:hypothetical protein